MRKPVLYMGVGVPLCGKTTYFRNDPLLRNFPVVSSDDLIEKLASVLDMTYTYVFKDVVNLTNEAAKHAAQKHIQNRRSFIWDQTNLTKKARASRLQMAGDDYHKVAVVFKSLPLDQLLSRDLHRNMLNGKKIGAQVISDMLAKFEMPTLEEGFHSIEYH